jgi:hypothetical protein
MQTFLAYADFNESAAVLDNKRLNKQLLEGRQIYQIISQNRTNGGWVNHPAVKMWRHYDNAFFNYLTAIKNECDNRNIKTDKNWDAIISLHNSNWNRGSGVVSPPWLNDERVHQSHRNNLYRKDPDYYYEFKDNKFISCCETCSYVWPSHLLMYNRELLEPFSYFP